MSCNVVIYDVISPKEAVSAFETVANSNNQRKFVLLSTFMTWARTELPELPPEDETGADKRVDEDTLINEFEAEP